MDLESALVRRDQEPGFWRDMWQQLRLVLHLLREPEVPFYLKLLPFAGLIYVLFPFDLVTDLVPVIGQLDDVTALLVSSKVFIELAPPQVVARHMRAIRAKDGLANAGADDSAQPTSDEEIANTIVIDAEHEVLVEGDREPQ
jgi:uncharacterized membrane protein YkvA (DUF1232 family)